ncbi:phospholipid/cholesterol/gamma-HCH transport system permease protein [Roseivivax lentus]|uniref:Phospholipid/cholesterol/gamma-HCH transport system permease protein n=1 Tax=Roseivivax lentus TaxID=633194 RepID=A0A1N7NGV7_9RHOB|nr:MlaE family lipid ABC transporter permease subunit [Roseivivax lentus]SIS97491.1 phospholipid/cholesterol/gamma-HCH transport system permease protein [Roseivivax lentus]
MNDALSLTVETAADHHLVRLSGVFTVHDLPGAEPRLAAIAADRAVLLDLAALERLDTAGAWALDRLEARIAEAGFTLETQGAAPHLSALMRRVDAAIPTPDLPEDTGPKGLTGRLDAIGRRVVDMGKHGGVFLNAFGMFLYRLGQSLRHPSRFHLTALVAHCEDVGWRAVPIVSLLSFLIGVVLAFQGATQLRQFGAEVFVVDLIAISILRELGILLTSIIVAGRTASAFTAAIGSMKMREEIDAMQTLGIDPAHALFVPRILALILMLPILGLVANVMGLLGGGIMSYLVLDISPGIFLVRLIEGTDVSNVFVGLIKAPVFAVIIGVVGCNAGMQVGSNAESLGRQTSNAVVQAIFAVIVADAIFSVFFAEIGL